MDKIGTTPVYETAEEKAEAFRKMKNEASKRMLARKAEALQKLIALAEKSGTPEEKAAASYLKGGRQIGINKNEVVEFIRNRGSVSEDDVWLKFKKGRVEMKRIMKANPELKFENDHYSIEE